jgi:hypothetical protein
MQEQGGSLKQIDNIDEIKDIFRRRASRKEFPIVKYIVYLKFAAVVQGDQKIISDLVRYGFDVIYEKLRWLDKVSTLEIASALNEPYT